MTQWKHDKALRLSDVVSDSQIAVGKEVPKVIVLENIARASLRVCQASYCMVAYLHQDEKHFIALGFDEEVNSQIAHLPKGVGLLGELWKENSTTIRLDDIAKHRQSSGCPHGHPILEAFLGTPIRFDNETLGVIYLSKRPGDTGFLEADETTLEVLASACAIELVNAHTFEELKSAYTDLEARSDELNKANQQLQEHDLALEKSAKALNRANQQLKVHALDLELLNEELISANRAKDQFLANTSHELRTPLNAIIGFSDLLTDTRLGELNDKQKRYVGHVSTSGKRLLNIINTLLDISKIESGMMEIHETDFDPLEVGENLIAELKPLADNKGIQLSLIHSLESATCIYSDKDKVHQMLVNLLGNAIKFTPEDGKVTLYIDLKKSTHDEFMFSCRVVDTGIGISPEDQTKIFTPFVQANGSITRTHGGTGLGLSLAKHMSELLGGSILLESALEQGSTFTVSMPVTMAEKSTVYQQGNSLSTPFLENDFDVKEVLPESVPQPVVMIVDEYQARSKAVRDMFSGEGYRVVVVSQLDEVSLVIASCNPLLIILGLSDDSDSIYDRLQRLKHLDVTNKTPTILLAGDAENPQFTTGATIGQVKNGLDRQGLLEMVSHFGIHAPKPPSIPTVLIVDDDASVRDYLKETLSAEGYRILLASNGDEGIRMAIERDPDLIILDLMMPGISGFEVIHRLKGHASACDIPVVIFTAKELTRSEALMLGQDVERILVKGMSSRRDVLQQLHKLELLYPVRAKLMDTKLDCFNVRYMQRRLDQELARSIRYSHNFTVLAWEMDGFDTYCEKHGKRWGLAALKSSVSILYSIIRKGDVLARLNDNRLMLLLPGLSITESFFVAEKIRLRISRQRLPLPNHEYGHLTVSIGGVASGECKQGDDIISLLEQRIITAMKEGGNRMILEDV